MYHLRENSRPGAFYVNESVVIYHVPNDVLQALGLPYRARGLLHWRPRRLSPQPVNSLKLHRFVHMHMYIVLDELCSVLTTGLDQGVPTEACCVREHTLARPTWPPSPVT